MKPLSFARSAVLLSLWLGSTALAQPVSALVWRGAVIEAADRVRAFSGAPLEPDLSLQKQLSANRLALATEADALFGADARGAWRFDPDAQRWRPLAPFPAATGPLLRLTADAAGPVALFERGIYDVAAAAWHPWPEVLAPAPLPLGQWEVRDARLFGAQLWVATRAGETGGVLLVLDRGSGEWAQHHDALYVPTGISEGLAGALVSWTGALGSRVLIHALDGSAAGLFLPDQRAPVEQLVFNRYDRRVYATQGGKLVRLGRRRAQPVAELPCAGALHVLGPDAFAIGCTNGPVRVRAGDTQPVAAR